MADLGVDLDQVWIVDHASRSWLRLLGHHLLWMLHGLRSEVLRHMLIRRLLHLLPLHVAPAVLLFELYSHRAVCGVGLLLLHLHHLQLLVLTDRNRSIILGLQVLRTCGYCLGCVVDSIAELIHDH